jgi:2-desacetyl-2-hydroxyethyl bacteriochlorophyllide A dehydrogenase
MRAFVVSGPGRCSVDEVDPPRADRGQVVVDIERAGVCGTDVEFFTGEMAYLHQGDANYPMRLGHEWCGRVVSVGPDVDAAWIGVRVTGDTMLGCGRCQRCRSGRHHVCADRVELGIRGGWPGALAEQMAVPVSALQELPAAVDATAGAMVEPGGSAYRAVDGCGLEAGERLLVVGPGTIGLLAALFARARGLEVHVLGVNADTLEFARTLGLDGAWTASDLPDLPFDAIIDATNAASIPARALDLVEPARRVVYVGLAGTPSTIDTRTLALKDVTAVGILGGSAGLIGVIAEYASGRVDPRPLVAATVSLDEIGAVLAGTSQPHAGHGPKIHVDPRR